MPVALADGALTFHPNIAVTDVPLNEYPHQFQEPNPCQEAVFAATNSASFSASCLLKPSPLLLFKHLT